MMPQRAGCDRRKTENNGDASLAHSDDLCRRQRGLRARHRGQSGAVPLFSTLLVAVMLIVSMLLFARLVQRLSDLQITSVLQLIGDKGREVIRDTFQRLDERPKIETKPVEPRDRVALRPTIQIIAYSGSPRTIAKVNVDARVQQAERSGASSRWSPLWATPLSMAALSCGFTETRSGLPKRM